MVHVDTSIERTIRLPVPLDEAWAFLLDVPRWGRLYPHVEAVRPYPEGGDGAYWWTMEPLGPPVLQVVVEYACRYAYDEAARSVEWTPIPGAGNAAFGGRCVIADDGDGGTVGEMRLDADLGIPAPRLLRGIVRPTVEFEMGRMTNLFVERLQAEAAL